MKKKLIRITTVPISLEKLLEGQLSYMNKYYEVIAVSSEGKALDQFGKENGISTYCVDMSRQITPFRDFKAVFRLYNFLRKEKPLIVHTHTPKAGIVGMLAAKMAGVPIRLHTVAGLPLMETTGYKRKVLNYVEKLTYRLAVAVYPNSIGLKKIILEEKFTTENKVKVLAKGSSNGIDTDYFNPDVLSRYEKSLMREKIGIPEGDMVFVFIGRIVSQKGINELVSAFFRLNEKDPHTSLLLVGSFEEDLDPIKPGTVQLIEQCPKIFSAGYQQDVRPFLAISNVLAFPSYREGFPNVVMQAGAMNLPSIVSDINGCNEIINHGFNGIIIPAKNENALFEAMERVKEDKKFRLKLAENSREEISRYYGRRAFWEILLREYQKLESENLKS